jgi:hypothetical protein
MHFSNFFIFSQNSRGGICVAPSPQKNTHTLTLVCRCESVSLKIMLVPLLGGGGTEKLIHL